MRKADFCKANFPVYKSYFIFGEFMLNISMSAHSNTTNAIYINNCKMY